MATFMLQSGQLTQSPQKGEKRVMLFVRDYADRSEIGTCCLCGSEWNQIICPHCGGIVNLPRKAAR